MRRQCARPSAPSDSGSRRALRRLLRALRAAARALSGGCSPSVREARGRRSHSAAISCVELPGAGSLSGEGSLARREAAVAMGSCRG